MPFTFVTRPQEYPAQCVRCIRRENLVDFDLDIPDYGRLYLCSVCFGELADFAGLVTQQQYEGDLQRARLAQQEAEERAERTVVAPEGLYTRDDVERIIEHALDSARNRAGIALWGDGAVGIAPVPPAPEPEREPGSAGDAVDVAGADEPEPAGDAGADEPESEDVPAVAGGGGKVVSIYDLIPDARYRATRDDSDDAAGGEGPDSGEPTGVLD